jgi:hypothetical protein
MPTLEEQLVESSRALTDLIVADIGSNQYQFDRIMELMYRDEYPLSMRAAWVAFLVGDKHPEVVKPHVKKLVTMLHAVKVEGVKRSALKMLEPNTHLLSEDEFGMLADLAFSWAEDPKQPIAVRAFSIDILLRVIKVYPDITNELIAILEGIMPDGSKGLKNKCSKLLKQLRK